MKKTFLFFSLSIILSSCALIGKKKNKDGGGIGKCEDALIDYMEEAQQLLNPSGPYVSPYNQNNPLPEDNARALYIALKEMANIRNPNNACKAGDEADSPIYNQDFYTKSMDRIPEKFRS